MGNDDIVRRVNEYTAETVVYTIEVMASMLRTLAEIRALPEIAEREEI